jgi:L-amino acid N-acyltransferase YncA
MKYTAANIASALARQGIPVSKHTRRERQDGVHVVKAPGRRGVGFFYHVWSECEDRTAARLAGEQRVIAALAELGYEVQEARPGNGAWWIIPQAVR